MRRILRGSRPGKVQWMFLLEESDVLSKYIADDALLMASIHFILDAQHLLPLFYKSVFTVKFLPSSYLVQHEAKK